MSFEVLVSISGKPGLFLLTSQTRGGFLAESLFDGKTVNVSARQSVSLLSEIAIDTLSAEVPLREVFQKIAAKEDGKHAIDYKVSKAELEEYFFGILPDYDEDRVYVSDIKKVIQWYNILQQNNIDNFEEPVAEDKEAEALKAAATKSTAPKAAVTKAAPKASSSKKGTTPKHTVARKAQ